MWLEVTFGILVASAALLALRWLYHWYLILADADWRAFFSALLGRQR